MRIREIMTAFAILTGSAQADDGVDYLKQIKPVFQARCYACHGALKQKGGLRLDTAALAIRGGKQPAISPGNLDASPLIDRVTTDKNDAERMPPEGEPLKPSEIELLKTWITQGAKAPADEKPERDPREHWAFQPPVRPTVPSVDHPELAKNPIDAFITAKRQEHGLTPQPPADKRVWLRRVSLDLIGLPPTRKELDAFVADNSDAATDRVVTRLLDSPQYGERWGRHWMDIWRYSDWWGLGVEVRNSQKHIWHWRDWIIESLTADIGYDQMLREMLAADELYPNDLDKLRASGFLARQYFKFNRTSWLDETIEHTAKSMLGLTFNCAKCHDHKYDPILQVDYYRMRAIIEPYQVRTDMVPGEIDFEKDGIPRAFDCNIDVKTFLHIRGDDRQPDKSIPLDPAFPAFLTPVAPKIEPVSLPPEAYKPGLRPFVVESYLKEAVLRIAEARATLEAAKKNSAESPQAVAVAEKTLATSEAQYASIKARCSGAGTQSTAFPERSRLADLRGSPTGKSRGHRESRRRCWPRRTGVAQGESRQKGRDRQETRKSEGRAGNSENGTRHARRVVHAARGLAEDGRIEPGNRGVACQVFPHDQHWPASALARWMTDPKHPLPARVAVNHLWSRHFGRPLVPTVFDFGRKGTPPTHPELLDWLATEFVQNGWSMKNIHRLIVTSNTYRLSSSSAGASPQTPAGDPENVYYWRANPVRMESEVVRDSLLHLAGELDLTHGGPPIPVADEHSRRRSLYFVHSHNEHQKFLSTFDDASVLECYRRVDSIVPQQALALENSKLATASAEKIARLLEKENPGASDREFIRAAFLTVLSVVPSEDEQAVVQDAFVQLLNVSRQAGRTDPIARRAEWRDPRTPQPQRFCDHPLTRGSRDEPQS